jgi:diaminohydroxyphosphoribosylaminopyrimidine deaminase/5-amino-6-(5-phosphoribosylamino)uracil reductase
MVGCVIVHNNTIIGSGYHKCAGESHAEVLAIESVENKELLFDSTLYVNLEPCSHYGKTPPCSLAIIQNKISLLPTIAWKRRLLLQRSICSDSS